MDQFGQAFDAMSLKVRYSIAVEAEQVGDAFENHQRHCSWQALGIWDTHLKWDLFDKNQQKRIYRGAMSLIGQVCEMQEHMRRVESLKVVING